MQRYGKCKDFSYRFVCEERRGEYVRENDLERASRILRKEFGSDWKKIVQTLGTKELTQCVGQELTSFMAFPEREEGGSNKWRGNCSPQVVEKLLRFVIKSGQYGKKEEFLLLDPMSGSGTSQDVAEKLHISSVLYDLNPHPPKGIGNWNALKDEVDQSADLIFFHPPYHDIIRYSGNMWGRPHEDDLSRCENYEDYIEKLNYGCKLLNIRNFDPTVKILNSSFDDVEGLIKTLEGIRINMKSISDNETLNLLKNYESKMLEIIMLGNKLRTGYKEVSNEFELLLLNGMSPAPASSIYLTDYRDELYLSSVPEIIPPTISLTDIGNLDDEESMYLIKYNATTPNSNYSIMKKYSPIVRPSSKISVDTDYSNNVKRLKQNIGKALN